MNIVQLAQAKWSRLQDSRSTLSKGHAARSVPQLGGGNVPYETETTLIGLVRAVAHKIVERDWRICFGARVKNGGVKWFVELFVECCTGRTDHEQHSH